jgi:hypothetical protein
MQMCQKELHSRRPMRFLSRNVCLDNFEPKDDIIELNAQCFKSSNQHIKLIHNHENKE